MKFKKIIACILAATATLAFAGMGTGCAVKDWFDEKFNKDKQTEIAVIGHTDDNGDGYCDGCNSFMETIGYTEVDCSIGENKIANTWYRIYDDIDMLDYSSSFLESVEDCMIGGGMYGNKLHIRLDNISLTGIYHDSDFEFKAGDGLTVVRGNGYYDFCFRKGATFTTVGSDLEAGGYPISFTVTITDDLHWDIVNIDLDHFKRLDVPETETVAPLSLDSTLIDERPFVFETIEDSNLEDDFNDERWTDWH